MIASIPKDAGCEAPHHTGLAVELRLGWCFSMQIGFPVNHVDEVTAGGQQQTASASSFVRALGLNVPSRTVLNVPASVPGCGTVQTILVDKSLTEPPAN